MTTWEPPQIELHNLSEEKTLKKAVVKGFQKKIITLRFFEPALNKYCLPPALNGRGESTSRAAVLRHDSIQTVLAPSPNPTWALGSAAQLSLFLALHCIITRSSLHSLPRLCTTPLHCSSTRNTFFFQLIFPTLSHAAALQPALLCHPALHCSSSLPSLVSQIPAHGFWFCTAALQKALGSATSLQCSVAQPSPGASNPPCCFHPCSALSIQCQAAMLLQHPQAFVTLTLFCSYLWYCKDSSRAPMHPSAVRSCFSLPEDAPLPPPPLLEQFHILSACAEVSSHCPGTILEYSWQVQIV